MSCQTLLIFDSDEACLAEIVEVRDRSFALQGVADRGVVEEGKRGRVLDGVAPLVLDLCDSFSLGLRSRQRHEKVLDSPPTPCHRRNDATQASQTGTAARGRPRRTTKKTQRRKPKAPMSGVGGSVALCALSGEKRRPASAGALCLATEHVLSLELTPWPL